MTREFSETGAFCFLLVSQFPWRPDDFERVSRLPILGRSVGRVCWRRPRSSQSVLKRVCVKGVNTPDSTFGFDGYDWWKVLKYLAGASSPICALSHSFQYDASHLSSLVFHHYQQILVPLLENVNNACPFRLHERHFFHSSMTSYSSCSASISVSFTGSINKGY